MDRSRYPLLHAIPPGSHQVAWRTATLAPDVWLLISGLPLYVFAHFSTDWSRLQVHLFLSLFLTVPMVVYLALETWRSSRGNTKSRQRVDVARGEALG